MSISISIHLIPTLILEISPHAVSTKQRCYPTRHANRHACQVCQEDPGRSCRRSRDLSRSCQPKLGNYDHEVVDDVDNVDDDDDDDATKSSPVGFQGFQGRSRKLFHAPRACGGCI